MPKDLLILRLSAVIKLSTDEARSQNGSLYIVPDALQNIWNNGGKELLDFYS
jgi:hypothetical protein